MTETQSDPASAHDVPAAGPAEETAPPAALEVSGIVKSYQLGKEKISVL